ncbi:putative autotransporter protein [Yersinia intermedia]|uniref:Putative autotransporter protein n=1 Tax=Yersinia intermedia TaxID=631 RepID=A0A0H5LWW4_YERIN|nr:autotransporter outer membrane beta-barrel domain-containing protein [Yersinia intermedia]CRY55633.1 putative autotransporter protein [Yersinia intermedia]
MRINKTAARPYFSKTLLATLLLPTFSPLDSCVAQTISVTDGRTVAISGDYDSSGHYQPAVIVKGVGSTVTGASDLAIYTTGRVGNGVNLSQGGALKLQGSIIRTEGEFAAGIRNSEGTINLQGGVIMTSGDKGSGIYSAGIGSRVNINGTVLNISGDHANAVEGFDGAKLTLNNTIMNISGGHGIYLDDFGTTLTGTNNAIHNTHSDRESGIGVYIANGGLNATLDNTTLNMTEGYAGVAVGQDSMITMNGLTVTGTMNNVFDINGSANISNANIDLVSGAVLRAAGDNLGNKAVIVFNNVNAISRGGNSALVDVNSYTDVTLHGGSYQTKSAYATGVWVPDNTSSVNISHATVMTDGNNAIAIENRGTAVASHTTVKTTGDNAHGLYSQSIFNATNMFISTMGNGSAGAITAKRSHLNLDGATVQTMGDASMVLGTFVGSSINANNLVGTSSGANAYALWTQARGTMVLQNSQITTTGMDAGGIYAAGADAIYSEVTLDNAQIVSEQGTGVRAIGANINIELKNGSQLVGGNGLLVNANTHVGTTASPLNIISNVNLKADNHSVLVGDIQADANNNVSLTLKNNATWTGAALNAAHIDIDQSSRWNVASDADVRSLNVLGQVNFLSTANRGAATARSHDFNTLTVNGDLTGNGRFVFNARLGDDNSPADRLHVTGNATGEHNVTVVNQGGLGALTTGSGIPLIRVDGDARYSQFLMSNLVTAGAYKYYLYQTDEHSWNLQSYLSPVDPADPADPADLVGPQNPQNPADPGKPITVMPSRPKQPVIAYRDEVAGYIAAPWLNAFYGFTTLGRLNERRGSVKGATNGFNQASWGRISGQHNHFDAGRFSYGSDIRFAQLGHDLYQAENTLGTQVTAGVMMTLGQQQTDTQDKARAIRPDLSIDTGKITTDAYGVGGYYTLITSQGGYVDLVGQGTLYRNRYQSQHDAKQNGYGVVMSAEVGQAYLIANNWKVAPQGQLKYQYLHLSGFSDDISGVNGTHYSIGEARTGLRVFREATLSQVITPYYSTDIVYLLGDNPEVTIDTASLRPTFSQTYWQGGVGVNAKVNSNVNIYVDAKYQRAFDGEMDGYTGNLGVKVSF